MIEDKGDLRDYLSELQVEWISADLRLKFFVRDKDKSFWRDRVLPGKRLKIESVSSRLGTPNIFTEGNRGEQVRKEYYTKVYSDKGFPKLSHPHEKYKTRQQAQDKLNYYSANSIVWVNLLKDSYLAEVITVDLSQDKVLLRNKQGETSLEPISNIVRADLTNPCV